MKCFNCGVQLHPGEEGECRLCGVKFSKHCPSLHAVIPAHPLQNFALTAALSLPGGVSKVQSEILKLSWKAE